MDGTNANAACSPLTNTSTPVNAQSTADEMASKLVLVMAAVMSKL
ncbi:hypothetical protein P4S70_22360 [Enterovibrio sp. Hal110]